MFTIAMVTAANGLVLDQLQVLDTLGQPVQQWVILDPVVQQRLRQQQLATNKIPVLAHLDCQLVLQHNVL
jgi:hypothetical protein